MKLFELYNNLKTYSDFNKGDNTELFLETVDEIVLVAGGGSIQVLLHYFDDNSNYGWVLESLACALDYYPNEIYVPEFIKSIPILLSESPNWLATLTYPIFNTPDTLECFKKNMKLISKYDMHRFLDFISQQSEGHRGVCNKLKNSNNDK